METIYLTSNEVCKRLKISRTTLKMLVTKGLIDAVVVNANMNLYPVESVDKYLLDMKKKKR